MVTAQQPTIDCPKCGNTCGPDNAYAWSGPKHQHIYMVFPWGARTDDWLAWTCEVCSCETTTPCEDAKET